MLEAVVQKILRDVRYIWVTSDGFEVIDEREPLSVKLTYLEQNTFFFYTEPYIIDEEDERSVVTLPARASIKPMGEKAFDVMAPFKKMQKIGEYFSSVGSQTPDGRYVLRPADILAYDAKAGKVDLTKKLTLLEALEPSSNS